MSYRTQLMRMQEQALYDELLILAMLVLSLNKIDYRLVSSLPDRAAGLTHFWIEVKTPEGYKRIDDPVFDDGLKWEMKPSTS